MAVLQVDGQVAVLLAEHAVPDEAEGQVHLAHRALEEGEAVVGDQQPALLYALVADHLRRGQQDEYLSVDGLKVQPVVTDFQLQSGNWLPFLLFLLYWLSLAGLWLRDGRRLDYLG